jgi:hypothetical protein
MKARVYVVMAGEKYEGGHICSIFATESEAVKFATEYAKTMPFTAEKHPGRNDWSGGRFFLTVEEWEVFPSAEVALEEINN